MKWTAPEAINHRRYSNASDVWSFGCALYEIWSLGHKPFEDYSNKAVSSLHFCYMIVYTFVRLTQGKNVNFL